jgi:ligand-binding sensor domain-containing protein/signal transduction histidine kinase
MIARLAYTALMEKERGVKLCIQLQFRNRNRCSFQSSNSHPGAGVKPSWQLYRSFLTVTALLCLLGPVRSFALDPAKSVYQYNCQSWTRREDLPANSINAITQTKDGYLWFGTSKGLVRFDGLDFKEIGMPNHIQFRSRIISSLASSQSGGLWFGINAGSLGYYDGQNFFPATNVSWVERGMDVRSIREDSNAVVWVAAQAVTGRFVKGTTNEISFSSRESGNEVSDGMSLCCGANGRVWMGTVRRGLYYLQDGKINLFPDNSVNQSIIFALAEDSAGQIWIGTDSGLRCYDASFQRKEIGDAHFEVRTLLVDRHGVVWVGTSGNGLMCYKNGQLTTFKKNGGLVNDFVTALFEDREGSLWIGTSDGLSQLTDLKFPIYSSSEGLIGGSCHSVSASQAGGLWVAMSGGFSYFDGKQARNYTDVEGWPNPYIKRIFEAKNGDIYLTDGSTVGIFAEGKLVARYTPSAMPVAMAEDTQGVVVSVVSNLFRVSRNQFVPYPFKNGQVPPSGWIYNLITGRDGSLWVASVNGLFRVKDGTYQQWSVPEGLSWGKVNWVCEDSDGAIWAGLPTGMARLKNNQIRNIARTNGLFDDFIFAIVPDDLGYFWVDSVRGIFRVSRQSLNDFCDGKTDQVKCEAYDGLEMVKTIDKTDQEWSGCKTRNGRIWFPSPQGVVMIDPASLRVNPVPPLVYIKQVRVNGMELKDNQATAVPQGKGELEFQYTALSYVAPLRIQFRYRLEGYDQGWIEAENRRSAFYTNLKPGKYTFRVIACNADGVWDKTGDSFDIELLPHFYQTIWFYLGCAVLASATLMGIYAWRVGHLRKRQRELQKARELLEAKVEERTAELEAQKTRLESEIEERQRMQLEVERIHRQLIDASRQAGQAEVASSVLHNVGNVLNSVNTSASIIADQVRDSKVADVSQVAELLIQHQNDLAEFLVQQGRGEPMTNYLKALGQRLVSEQTAMLKELQELVRNIDHIKEIVAMQQSYAQVSGIMEKQSIPTLVDDALRMHAAALARHQVHVVRQFDPIPDVLVDKHKVLQILVNLISNAKYALSESAATERRLALGVKLDPDNQVRVSVTDNGVGIAPENLDRIFSLGFTTRQGGHGLGLHSGFFAAREMGGTLLVHSDGPGKGATFTLAFPAQPKEKS